MDHGKRHFAAIYVPDIATQRGLSDLNNSGSLTTTLIRDNMFDELL